MCIRIDDRDFQGKQPVRVLEHDLPAWFECKYPEFRQELKTKCQNHPNAGLIKYNIDEIPVRCALPFVKRDGEIVLYEVFLSYIWALSYAFVVIFDEGIHGPRAGIQPAHGMGLGRFLNGANKLFDYGLSLLDLFQSWPKELPSPETCNEVDTYYVEKANGIYLAAADFILCHEFAHIACGHFDKTSDTPSKMLEREADLIALEWVMNGIREPERPQTTVAFGAVAGLGSLIFLGRRLTSRTHPDIDERIANVMTRFPIEDRDNLWGIATVFFFLWKERFKVSLKFANEYDTYRVLFEDIIRQLQPLKGNTSQDRRYDSLITVRQLD